MTSAFQYLGIPNEVQVLLFTLAIILGLSFFLAGADLGIFKLPALRPSQRRIASLSGVLLFAVCVVASMPFFKVPTPDKEIANAQSMVFDYQNEFLTFTNKLHRSAGTQVGEYDQNIEFYKTWDTKLDILAERLRLLDLPDCPTVETIDLSESAGAPEAAGLEVEGSCLRQVIVINRLLLRNYEALHKERGPLVGISEDVGGPAESVIRFKIYVTIRLVASIST